MDKQHPRVGKFADKPGSYRLVIRSNRQLLNPGEDLWIQVLITDYGNIQAAKLIFYPDKESINGKESKVWFDVQRIGDKYYFGKTEIEVGEDGATIDLGTGGLKLPQWDCPTLFVDTSESLTPKILTETIQHPPNDSPDAPITINLKLRKKARPGQHSLNLVLTYYNGECWCNSETTFQFSVQNFYQQHEIKIWLLGLSVAVIGLLSSFF